MDLNRAQTQADIYGDGVNVAARIQDLASPGGIAISCAAVQKTRSDLDLDLDDLGVLILRNRIRPIRVYRFPRAGHATDVGVSLSLPTEGSPDPSLSLSDESAIARIGQLQRHCREPTPKHVSGCNFLGSTTARRNVVAAEARGHDFVYLRANRRRDPQRKCQEGPKGDIEAWSKPPRSLQRELPDANALLAECARRGLEGIVVKRKDAASGTRSGWVKVKTSEWKADNQWRGEFFEKR